MASSTYDFRQFQAELAALSREPAAAPATAAATPAEPAKPARSRGRPPGKKALAAQRLARARAEFLALRDRHELTVADVVAFFPEEEGVAYLQKLLVETTPKLRRRRKDAMAD